MSLKCNLSYLLPVRLILPVSSPSVELLNSDSLVSKSLFLLPEGYQAMKREREKERELVMVTTLSLTRSGAGRG